VQAVYTADTMHVCIKTLLAF